MSGGGEAADGGFLVAMLGGLLALGAHVGSGNVFAPLEAVFLHGSPCHAQAHRIGSSAALFACEFDPTLKVDLARMPRFTDGVTASLSVLEQRRAYRAPLKCQGVEGTVSKVRQTARAVSGWRALRSSLFRPSP